ncbi:hypothetical protein, partial [uncultured Jannaschia sp.]
MDVRLAAKSDAKAAKAFLERTPRGHVPGRGVAEAAIGFLGRVGLRKPT